MFTLILGAAGPSGLMLLLILIATFAIAYRFWPRSTPLDPKHQGKAHTHTCKFDAEEVRRTALQPRPPVIMPVLNTADARVQAALAGVQAQPIKDNLRSLSGEVQVTAGGRTGAIASRNSFGKDIELALLFLEDFYRGLGIKTTRHPYTVRGRTYYNLVAELPGKVNPAKVLIIGSHLDSTAGRPSSAESLAPGADDDGSGTVSVMEIAKALVGLPLGCTIRLLHFTGEEQGLYGSYAYSDKVAADKTDVVAMLQLDMVGWCAKPGNRLDIHDGKDKNGSHALVGAFLANVSRYGINLKVVDTHNHAVDNRSDHAGFHDHGYKAVLISEEFTDDGFNPNYHSTRDKVDTINLPYVVEVVRLTIATAADLADLQP